MTGQDALQRESIVIHYEPFWPTAMPARYAFDRRWKLYDSGEFFDMHSDPLENSPLDIDGLEEEGATAYKALYARMQSMPGQLRSNRRWLPPQFYPLLIAAGIGLALMLLSIGLLWRYLRK